MTDQIASRAMDPFHQTFNLKAPDGTNIPVSIDDINFWQQYAVRICINYASQIGASIVLLVVLLILTHPDKRRAPVFMLNCITLLLNFLQRLLQTLYFTGPFYNFYAYITYDYDQVPSTQFGISVAGIVLQTIQIMCLEASLVLQVRAVCATMSSIWRTAVLVVSILVAAVVVGFRMAVMVLNSEAVVRVESFTNYQWLAATSLYTLTASICFFSAIFVSKLLVALRQRRKLGLRQFGPMQIIFIMGCQTLIIPAIFSILQWVNGAPELGSQVLTITAIFLPLSAIWASQSLQGAPTSSAIDRSARRRLMGFMRSGKSSKNDSSAPPSAVNTTATDEAATPKFGLTKKGDDIETGAGGLMIVKKQEVELSAEKSDG